MTQSENIMVRWSRMKRESGRTVEPDGSSSGHKPNEAEAEDLNQATAATPPTDSPSSATFDLASLPPLQSITAGTDIRSFLGSSVPVELTRAALRRAWVTDPAIRDFIGIAENQWDFNDPTAMPGFGPLRAEDVPGLVGAGETAQACGATAEEVRARAIPAAGQVDETDHARAAEYALLAALLSHSPDANMIEQLARLSGDATPLGAAHASLSSAAASMNPERIEREYFDLFVGLGGGELFPYASYYLTGYLHGRPLARIRETLKQIGLERTEGQSEPEDHVAVLFEVMAGLASGRIIAPGGTDRTIFENHLKPWTGRFFSDLEHARSATFYKCVGSLGRIFMEIETEAFSLSTQAKLRDGPTANRPGDCND
jgi:TorA maturation chaperone TorD